jgi:hypothetical protein
MRPVGGDDRHVVSAPCAAPIPPARNVPTVTAFRYVAVIHRSMEVPSDPPERCPVCSATYDSVSVHEAGLMVNMCDNERYRRVCFDPATRDSTPVIEFYHHTHAQIRGEQRTHAPTADAPDTSG